MQYLMNDQPMTPSDFVATGILLLSFFLFKDREHACANLLKSIGANGHLIHPFDNLNVIAGQGTLGLEVLEQVH